MSTTSPIVAPALPPVKPQSRALKFEVQFAGWRTKDRVGQTKAAVQASSEAGAPRTGGKTGLNYVLAQMQGELAEAANRLIAALYCTKIGARPLPTRPASAEDVKTFMATQTKAAAKAAEKGKLFVPTSIAEGDPYPIHLRTVGYQGLSGAWMPDGKPLYAPKGRRASSAVILALSDVVFTRLETDYLEVVRGQKSLSTFRADAALGISQAGVNVVADSSVHGGIAIGLTLWAGRANNAIKVAPIKGLDASRRVILRRILDGTYKAGSARMSRNRKGKWMLSLSWTDVSGVKQGARPVEGSSAVPVEGASAAPIEGSSAVPVEGTSLPSAKEDPIVLAAKWRTRPEPTGLIAGVDLRMDARAHIAYVHAAGGKVDFARDRLDVPASTLRVWDRMTRERNERLENNKQALGLREGRGITRKLRVVEATAGKLGRMTDTAVRQHAASIIRAVQSRGAPILVLEALEGITEAQLTQSEPLRGRERRAARRRYLRWHQGSLREAIRSAATREGLVVLDVKPAHTTQTCSACGLVWTRKTIEAAEKAGQGVFGAELGDESARFRCSCGFKAPVHRNAAINIARRGLDVLIARRGPEVLADSVGAGGPSE